MSRRDDIKRHHTIRHTYDTPPKRRISVLLLLMIIVVSAMAVSVLKTTPMPIPDTNPTSQNKLSSAPPPTRAQLFETASIVAGGQWGPELLDNCILLAKDFEADGDADAAKYAFMLANGSQPNDVSDKLIASIAANPEQAETYRLALTLSYQNSQLINRSK